MEKINLEQWKKYGNTLENLEIYKNHKNTLKNLNENTEKSEKRKYADNTLKNPHCIHRIISTEIFSHYSKSIPVTKSPPKKCVHFNPVGKIVTYCKEVYLFTPSVVPSPILHLVSPVKISCISPVIVYVLRPIHTHLAVSVPPECSASVSVGKRKCCIEFGHRVHTCLVQFNSASVSSLHLCCQKKYLYLWFPSVFDRSLTSAVLVSRNEWWVSYWFGAGSCCIV